MNCINFVVPMNPCRCGYYPDKKKCTCTPLQVKNYLGKISMPLLDRIDICVETVPVNFSGIDTCVNNNSRTSKEIKKRVQAAQDIQKQRYKNESFMFNSRLNPQDIGKYCILSIEAKEWLKDILNSISLSARAYHKILKTGRTIADLEGSSLIEKAHIMEAVCYRGINSKYWGQGVE